MWHLFAKREGNTFKGLCHIQQSLKLGFHNADHLKDDIIQKRTNTCYKCTMNKYSFAEIYV